MSETSARNAAITSDLLRELQQLNGRQRSAVLHPGNVVVRAGPGSGKTRTLVARLAWTLQTRTSPFRGAACITYTNAAANEVKARLKHLEVAAEGLACSTLHSFCLNEIVRPFAAIAGVPAPAAGSVIDAATGSELLQRCYDDVGIGETLAKWRTPQITRIRRAVACGDPLEGFDAREVQAAQQFDLVLSEAGLVDFESMVTRALVFVEQREVVRDLLRAKFPEIAVDEYQDLGGVLHRLVVALVDSGIRVFAVGDVDQSVFGFTGSDPRFLQELDDRSDFHSVELDVNYRSGQDIITASEAALGTMHGRRALTGKSSGEVVVKRLDAGLDGHAAEALNIVQRSLDAGVPPERVAILYPAQGVLLTALTSALSTGPFPYLHEREDRLPGGSASRLVQRIASRAVLSANIRRQADADSAFALLCRSRAPSISEIALELSRLRLEAGIAPPVRRLPMLRAIQQLIEPETGCQPEDLAGKWLDLVDRKLDLSFITSLHPDRDNHGVLQRLLILADEESLALQDLAASVEVIGKVALTTYHSAKGREFHTVVLPGLLNGLIPRDVNDFGTWRKPDASEESEQRRTFYVAISRAEESAFLLVGPGYHTANGFWRSSGPSKFVLDMARLLKNHN